MNVQNTTLAIHTSNPDRLFAFYRDVVGLPLQEGMGDHALAAGGATLFLTDHSEVGGPTKEPARFLLSFFVDDLAAEQARLDAAGVPCTRRHGREYWGGHVSTFTDPDGNLFQLIEFVEADFVPEEQFDKAEAEAAVATA